MTQPRFFSSRFARSTALILLFAIALTIRLYDLTDLPLDFHPTRQLLSAIKARGLYYETQPDGIPTWKLETAIRQAKLKADVEPVVFERCGRVYISIYGRAVMDRAHIFIVVLAHRRDISFMLVRDLVSFEGAIFSTAYYLFFPYAIIASRSFQPDSLMVMLTLSFWWIFARWMTLTSSSPSWRGQA